MTEDFNKLVEQYMLFDKKTLAELLALKELAGRIDVPVVPSYPQYPTYPTPPSTPYPYPWWPGIGDCPWWPQVWYTTTSNGKDFEDILSAPRKNSEFSHEAKQECGLNRSDVVSDTTTNANEPWRKNSRRDSLFNS